MLTVLAATGCTPRPLFLQPRPAREWPALLRSVKEAAREGRYGQADSALTQFGARHPGSFEAREAAYWRALLLVDPANPQSSSADALRMLNEYFAGGSTVEGYDEATVLRRVVMRTDSLARTIAQADRVIAEAQEAAVEARPVPSADAPAASRETREARAQTRETRAANRNLVEEVRRLRDELSKANQELERVRRRLQEQRP
jgi:hypothetical protein